MQSTKQLIAYARSKWSWKEVLQAEELFLASAERKVLLHILILHRAAILLQTEEDVCCQLQKVLSPHVAPVVVTIVPRSFSNGDNGAGNHSLS